MQTSFSSRPKPLAETIGLLAFSGLTVAGLNALGLLDNPTPKDAPPAKTATVDERGRPALNDINKLELPPVAPQAK